MLRFLRVIGPAVLLLTGLGALFISLAIGDGAAPRTLLDPGPVVRYLLPVLKLFVNISAALALGSLVLVCFALSAKQKEYGTALDVAAGAAAVYTVSAGALLVVTFINVTATPFGFDEAFSSGLGLFVSEIELGRLWLITVLLAAIVTVLCFAVRDRRLVIFVAIIAAASLVPMAQQGHAAGSSGHDVAVTGMMLHLVGAAVWLGGLLTLVLLLRAVSPKRMVAIISRYSSLALLAFIVVAASGYVSAQLRIGQWSDLLTPYGILIIAKVVALVALGIFGVLHRQFLIRRMTTRPDRYLPTFWWFVLAELAFMGIASGVAVALGRTAKPQVQQPASEIADATPAQILTGEPLPRELTPLSYLTEWRFDLLWTFIVVLGIFFYIAGVRRLKARGDAWPVHRTVLWVTGMLILFYITNGAFNVYERYLFSVHMMGHMVLSMAIPMFLVFGAPITLALRAIHKRGDGSWGAREWIFWAIHTPFATVITNPIVAAVLFAGSLWGFYYTPLFRWATTEHLGHQWMIVHFLITGYLFVQSLVGIDPVKYRLPYPFRLILLMGTMAFHAFFGLAIMSGTGLMLADWYGAMGRTWGPEPLLDQQNGGGIAWGIGEIPTVILAITVAVMWSRQDKKDAKRQDRNAARTGDAELHEYNAMLEKLAQKDQVRATRSAGPAEASGTTVSETGTATPETGTDPRGEQR
ncbi:cytochrome c oxidase assembly protein [Lysinibacter sp. HNR]|uniref:cytochrome c oxidase assembly protein n=1 Tax=Lysinibacter sp. HNR TaxID=3031408 RepID=UPI002435FB4C|nr:cytochrome c oxidase assembly protein [Lysinibacter sp. HNR]WGD37271.1 cytochrome c oxidase assembly protein [Lysinibacter sp. HNR]